MLHASFALPLRFMVVAGFLLGTASAVHAGAWPQKQGHLYNRLSINYFHASRDFDGDGESTDMAANGEFTDYNLSNYFEYGLLAPLTGFASLAYKRIRNDNDLRRDTTWGVGDIDVGLRQRLLENDLGVFAVQGLVKIPEAYDEHDDLTLGNGQYDLEARLLYGRSLYPLLPGYAGIEVGYRWRLEDPSDEVRYLVEFGGEFTKSLYGRVKLDGIYSADNGKKRDAGGNPTTTNHFDVGKLDLTVGYKLTPAWGLEAAWTPALYGRHTAVGATYTLAVSYATP